MKAPIFPVFALKTLKNQVIIGGGGGNEHFGKKNGVILLDETTYKDLDYLETEDIILGISIYEPGVNELNLKEDDLDWDEHDEGLDKSFHFNEDSKSSVEVSSTSSESEIIEESRKEIEIKENEVFLSCRGTNNFYLLKLVDSKFSLIKKVNKEISVQYFINSLFLIINKELFCILDVLKNLQKLDNLTKKKQKTPLASDSSHEEYIYTLFKKDDKILVEREEGRTDIPEKWENFFFNGNKIHKVVLEENNYTFVFNSNKFKYEKEIGDIYCQNDLLVFYLKGADSQLHFIENNETIYEIPKITCMNVEGEFVSVGTGDGYGYLFNGYMKVGSRKLCDYAITGISYNSGYFYYSSYNGLVDRKMALRPVRTLILTLGIIFILIALICGYLMKK